jgi:8-oxo-dGTP diphosphatase
MNQQKITACAFVYKDKTMLAVQRPAHKTFMPNCWELVGGHIEFGEDIEQGLKRELLEELNIEIAIEQPIGAFTYMANADTHSVEVIYLAKIVDESTLKVDPDAAQAVQWVSREEAKKLYDNSNAEFPFIMKGFDLINA